MEEDLTSYNENEYDLKSPTAVDYYDISDLSDDLEELTSDQNLIHSESENDDDKQANAEKCNSNLTCFPTSSDLAAVSDHTKPLISFLPLKYQNINIKSLYKDFEENKVLRFLRVFKPKKENLPNIWRSVSKNQKENLLNAHKSENNGLVKSKSSLLCESDEEKEFLRPKASSSIRSNSETEPCSTEYLKNTWRFGPAKLWYDMLDLPETVETYDYGFKLKETNNCDTHLSNCSDPTPDDAFLMVAQHSWEDDVIWDGDDVRDEVMKKYNNPNTVAGWIPSSLDRTVASFKAHMKHYSSASDSCDGFVSNQNMQIERMLHLKKNLSSTSPLFPKENSRLVLDRWEDDVIWDSEAMERISYPKSVEIDNDDATLDISETLPTSDKYNEHIKDRKYFPEQPPLHEESNPPSPFSVDHDPFNISNDEYYNPKMTQDAALKTNLGGTFLQHSIPAIELKSPFFPTYITPQKLRQFHRLPLKHYSHGPLSRVRFHGVYSLERHIRQIEKYRKKELEESGGGEMFFMRTPVDLSGKDGEIVFFEYSEEHPPLMMQVGMASKIRNYYKRRPGKDCGAMNFKYGELTYAHTSPFLGNLSPGQNLQAFESGLFRSPIFEHNVADTDFLIIRTRYGYYIREVESVYTVGQQLPLMEVPAPKSEKLNSFVKDFLMVFIYRLFWKSNDDPKRIKMDDIKKAFPTIREFNIRKRLKMCADFQRTGIDGKYWILKSHIHLPSEDEIRAMVSPEQCCAYYSMLAAEQRLKDAGYGDKFLLMAEEETDGLQNKIDGEIKVAPWNTTRAFIAAVKGKCLLHLSGIADPTGCGEGFSYVKVPNKPQWLKEEFSSNLPGKRLVKGTDADLRRLSLSNARKLLRDFNVPDEEIKKMTRWQIIDVIRTLSTEQAKAGEERMTKYARGYQRQALSHKKYKEECQRLFDLQNRVLSLAEYLSTDEESSSEEDSELEEMGKHIESILSNKKTAQELSAECEEAERKELQKMMLKDDPSEDTGMKNKIEKDGTNMQGKILKIYRTFINSDGIEFLRVETVRRPEVIDLYTRIRNTKNSEFIRDYAIDKEQKEEMRKERRRIQDQLRRLKRNEIKEKTKDPPRKKMKAEPAASLKGLKCGACGAVGHMRTNKSCPLYQPSLSLPPIPVAMTEEQEEEEEKLGIQDDNLIKVDETKLILSKQLLKHADELRRKSLVLKIPKEAVSSCKRKRSYDLYSDYAPMPKLTNRKRIDPVVSLGIIFENIVTEMKNLPDTQPFWYPVSSKEAPGYYTFIQKPMDLQTMKEKVRKQKYKSREEFLEDISQVVENSNLYNGSHSYLSVTAQHMLDHCLKRFSEEEEKLMQLERAINPMLDDPQVAFSFMLETIVSEQLKGVPESWPFHRPVHRKLAKKYHNIVKNPIDLDTIIQNCKANKYKSRFEFAADVELILTNCVAFNGNSSQFTKVAQEIVNVCHAVLETYDQQLKSFESAISQKSSNSANTELSKFVTFKREYDNTSLVDNLPLDVQIQDDLPNNENDASMNDHEYNNLNVKGVPSESSELDIEEIETDSPVLPRTSVLQSSQNVINATYEDSYGSEDSKFLKSLLHSSPDTKLSSIKNDNSDKQENKCDNIINDLILSDSGSNESVPMSSDDEAINKELWF